MKTPLLSSLATFSSECMLTVNMVWLLEECSFMLWDPMALFFKPNNVNILSFTIVFFSIFKVRLVTCSHQRLTRWAFCWLPQAGVEHGLPGWDGKSGE